MLPVNQFGMLDTGVLGHHPVYKAAFYVVHGRHVNAGP